MSRRSGEKSQLEGSVGPEKPTGITRRDAAELMAIVAVTLAASTPLIVNAGYSITQPNKDAKATGEITTYDAPTDEGDHVKITVVDDVDRFSPSADF